METVSSRYATALFELACEKQCADNWQEQMRFVKSVFAKNKEYLAFFSHYRITLEEKQAVLRGVFENKIDRDLMNFLFLLLDKKRIGNIVKISTAFNTLCNEAKNVSEGIVYSVNELSAEQKDAIEATVGKKLGVTLDLTNRLDANLISGVKVVVGDNVIDGSLQHRITSLKSELLKKAGD
ncbi:MAG: F0F1 ATP synthase subunit delta [Erysipelotrichaceae bacterium]|nr:F0F1 ATP synthase subunit delta [Erysipelotrichaceae bacterium]